MSAWMMSVGAAMMDGSAGASRGWCSSDCDEVCRGVGNGVGTRADVVGDEEERRVEEERRGVHSRNPEARVTVEDDGS